MQFEILASVFIDEPGALLINLTRILHFIGLSLGVGAATALDFIALRFFVGERVTKERLDVFEFGTHLVNAGLAILWISGFVFLALYYFFDPIKLTNEKVWGQTCNCNDPFPKRIIYPLICFAVFKEPNR